MTERTRVAAVERFQPGDRELVTVEGRQVAVLNVDGNYYAIENLCAHDNAPVCTGRVQAKLEAEYETPGERVEERFIGPPTITCPRHGWEYDLATGIHVGDDSISLRTYEVIAEDGEVYVVY